MLKLLCLPAWRWHDEMTESKNRLSDKLDYNTAIFTHIACLFGQLKAHLEREGGRIPDLDLQIARIALASNLPLITHSQRHFICLVNLAGLSLDAWL